MGSISCRSPSPGVISYWRQSAGIRNLWICVFLCGELLLMGSPSRRVDNSLLYCMGYIFV